MKKSRFLEICNELDLQMLIQSARHFDHDIPDEMISKFICSSIDMTIKENNEKLHDDLKLILRKVSHVGTWYSDEYAPYCGQQQVPCSMPRMKIQKWGHQCPNCKNEIGFSGMRLTSSPLNIRTESEIVKQ